MVWTWLVEKIGLKGLLFSLGALALGLVIFLAYRHYTGLLDDIKALSIKATQLESAVSSQHETIDAQQKAISEWKASQEKTERLLEESLRVSKNADLEVRRLNALFIDHDLGLLASKKPGLIQTRINAGSDRARRMLECATKPVGSADCASYR